MVTPLLYVISFPQHLGVPFLRVLVGWFTWEHMLRYSLYQRQIPTSFCQKLTFNVNNHAKIARVDVETNGQLHWRAGGKNHKWLSLSGIIFDPAA